MLALLLKMKETRNTHFFSLNYENFQQTVLQDEGFQF